MPLPVQFHRLAGTVPEGKISSEALRVSFRGQAYVLSPMEAGDPSKLLLAEGATEFDRPFDPKKWVLGVSAAPESSPEDVQAFYAVAHCGDPARLDDTLAFVSPRARGKRLSHLITYGVYLELLRLPRPFVLRQRIDHPKLRLHARCGFAPPLRPLRDGKVEVGRFDLHAVLSRIESENEIRELTLPKVA
ncbi:MAG: hypothetical protein HY900_06915 [Deltaproteobacteria bacterium]|nr:hypothetical protein [Deltaproteobacteria bacterium]